MMTVGSVAPRRQADCQAKLAAGDAAGRVQRAEARPSDGPSEDRAVSRSADRGGP